MFFVVVVVVLQLARRGLNVVLMSRSKDKLDLVANEISKKGTRLVLDLVIGPFAPLLMFLYINICCTPTIGTIKLLVLVAIKL